MKIYNEEIYAGLETAWSQIADFFIRPGEGLQVSKLFASTQGNPAQIILRRAGPDNVQPLGGEFVRPTTPDMNANIAHIDFVPYDGDAGQWGPRSAMIYGRFRGLGKGTLSLETSGEERLTINEDGEIDLTGCMSPDGRLRIKVGNRVIEL